MTAPDTTPPPAPTARLLRPALALLAGLGIMVLVFGGGVLVATLAALRHGNPASFPWYLATNLTLSLVGGAAGGFATSRITYDRSFFSVLVLALILLTPGVAPWIRGTPVESSYPIWYSPTLAVLAAVGAIVGGLAERRRSGVTPTGNVG